MSQLYHRIEVVSSSILSSIRIFRRVASGTEVHSKFMTSLPKLFETLWTLYCDSLWEKDKRLKHKVVECLLELEELVEESLDLFLCSKLAPICQSNLEMGSVVEAVLDIIKNIWDIFKEEERFKNVRLDRVVSVLLCLTRKNGIQAVESWILDLMNSGEDSIAKLLNGISSTLFSPAIYANSDCVYSYSNAVGRLPFDIQLLEVAIDNLRCILEVGRGAGLNGIGIIVSALAPRSDEPLACGCGKIKSLWDSIVMSVSLAALARVNRECDSFDTLETIESLRRSSLKCISVVLEICISDSILCNCILEKIGSLMIRVCFSEYRFASRLFSILLFIMEKGNIRFSELFEESMIVDMMFGIVSVCKNEDDSVFRSFLAFSVRIYGSNRSLLRSCILPLLVKCTTDIDGELNRSRFFERFRLTLEWYMRSMSCAGNGANVSGTVSLWGNMFGSGGVSKTTGILAAESELRLVSDLKLVQTVISAIECLIDGHGESIDFASFFRELFSCRKISGQFTVPVSVLPLMHVWANRYDGGKLDCSLGRLLLFIGNDKVECSVGEIFFLVIETYREFFSSSRGGSQSNPSLSMFYSNGTFKFRNGFGNLSESSILGLLEKLVTLIAVDDFGSESWSCVSGFIRECWSVVSRRRVILGSLLRFTTALLVKISVKKGQSTEDRRILRESQDAFLKTLDMSIGSLVKNLEYSISQYSESGVDDIIGLGIYFLGDFLSSVKELWDKVGGISNNLVTGLVFPLVRAHVGRDNKYSVSCDSIAVIGIFGGDSYQHGLENSYPSGPLKPSYVVLNFAFQMLDKISNSIGTQWRKEFFDLVFDSISFFSLPLFHIVDGKVCWCVRQNLIEKIFTGTSGDEGDRIGDFLERLEGAGGVSLSSFLSVGGLVSLRGDGASSFGMGGGEHYFKISILRKLSYALLSCPVDYHLPFLPLIHERIVDICRLLESSGDMKSLFGLSAGVFGLFRVVLIRFSIRNLGNFWPIIFSLMHHCLTFPQSLDKDEDIQKFVFAVCKFVEIWIKVTQQDSMAIHWWWLIGDLKCPGLVLSVAKRLNLTLDGRMSVADVFSREKVFLTHPQFDMNQLLGFLSALCDYYELKCELTITHTPIDIQQSPFIRDAIEAEFLY